MNRPRSLERLLRSLTKAEYGEKECITLDIWIDKGVGKEYEEVLEVGRGFVWEYGEKNVHERMEIAGLYEQWIYTWETIEKDDVGKGKDRKIKEMVVILEDDLEVSAQYWRWLKGVRWRYGGRKKVGGYSLQRATLRPMQIKGKFSGGLKVPEEYEAYAYLLVGTWGFSPIAERWIEFRRWYEDMRAEGKKPYVDGLMPTNWYKSQEGKEGVAKNMWSMWWIKFADEMKMFTIYANLPDQKTLAANWKEKGLHYSKGLPQKDFDLYNDTAMKINWPVNLLRLDWAGRVMDDAEVVRQNFQLLVA